MEYEMGIFRRPSCALCKYFPKNVVFDYSMNTEVYKYTCCAEVCPRCESKKSTNSACREFQMDYKYT